MAVPSPLSVNVTPADSASPPIAIEGAGKPDAVMVAVPVAPTVKVMPSPLEIQRLQVTWFP